MRQDTRGPLTNGFMFRIQPRIQPVGAPTRKVVFRDSFYGTGSKTAFVYVFISQEKGAQRRGTQPPVTRVLEKAVVAPREPDAPTCQSSRG